MGTSVTDRLIAYYERHLAGLDDEETYDTEALLTLVARDDIHDHWSELSRQQRQRVMQLDETLAEKHERMVDVLGTGAPKERRRWWWFLHEGPDARSQALASARER